MVLVGEPQQVLVSFNPPVRRWKRAPVNQVKNTTQQTAQQAIQPPVNRRPRTTEPAESTGAQGQQNPRNLQRRGR